MMIDQHLREERPPRMPEQDQRQVRMRGANDSGQLPHGILRRTQSTLAQPSELRGPSVLAEPGAPVPSVIVGVDGESGTIEHGDQSAISSSMLADTVQQLHDSARRAW